MEEVISQLDRNSKFLDSLPYLHLNPPNPDVHIWGYFTERSDNEASTAP